MRYYLIFISFVLCAPNVLANEEPLLVQANAYLDVRSGKLISPANILVVKGRIAEINPVPLPTDATIIQLQDKVLLPGLMDMHVHLDADFAGNFDEITYKESASKGAIRAARNAKKTLLAGFTTIRNVGQVHVSNELINVAVAEAGNENWIKAPRIIAAGHIISITGGHADLTMGLSERYGELNAINGVINGVDDAIAAVRYQIKHGARVIKITATAGVLSLEDTVGAQQLSDTEMKAIVEEAHRHHVKVAAHAHGTEGIIAAIKAGVDSIEHGSLVDKKAMRLMKKHNVFLVPTTAIVEEISDMYDKMDPIMAKKAQYVLPLAVKNLQKAIKSGVKIAMGTDAPLVPHGENAKEIIVLTERGMTPLGALQTATINAAELLGRPELGEIKKGNIADLIAVDENPTVNIKTLSKVEFVMKEGRIYRN